MAGRSDAATDRVSLASAPAVASGLSIIAWVKIAVDRNDFSTVCRFHQGSGSNTAVTLGMKSNGTQPAVFSPGNTTGITGTDLVVGTWTCIGFALAANGVGAFYRGTTPGTLTKTTGTVPISQTPDGLTFFGRSSSDAAEWGNLSIAYARAWAGQLSDAEMAAESASATEVRTSGLFDHWAFAGAALTGVNGHTLTAGSTALTSDTDPVLSTGNSTNLPRVTEAGSVTAPTRKRSSPVARVTETGSLTTPVRSHGQSLPRVTETATVAGFVWSRATLLPRVSETGDLTPPTRSRASLMSAVTEIGTFPGITRSHAASLSQVDEVGTVVPPSRSRNSPLPSVQGTGTVTAPARSRGQDLADIAEVGTVNGFIRSRSSELPTIQESGIIRPIARGSDHPLGAVVEAGVASGFARRRGTLLPQVTETGTFGVDPDRPSPDRRPHHGNRCRHPLARSNEGHLLGRIFEIGTACGLSRSSTMRRLPRVTEAGAVRAFTRSSGGGTVGIVFGTPSGSQYLTFGSPTAASAITFGQPA